MWHSCLWDDVDILVIFSNHAGEKSANILKDYFSNEISKTQQVSHCHAYKIFFNASALSFFSIAFIVMHARRIFTYKLIFFIYALYISVIICFTVIPAGTIQIATQGEGVPGLHTLTMSNAATAGGAIVQYAQGQDTQFFVPGVLLHHFRDIRKSYFISRCFTFITQYCIILK